MHYWKNRNLWKSVLPSVGFIVFVSLFASGTRAIAQSTNSVGVTVEPIDAPTEPQITLRSDTQEVSPDKNVITASGNVFFLVSGKQIEATANQVKYYRGEQRAVLIGNVVLKQSGKTIKADQITCLLQTEECTPAGITQLAPVRSQKR